MSPVLLIIVIIFFTLISYSRQLTEDRADFIDTYNDIPDERISSDVNAVDELYDFNNNPPSDRGIDTETESNVDPLLINIFSKRSRFYRKYPGKRQNSYANEIYDCNPNSRETIWLLHALHQARLGENRHIIFCNKLRNPKNLIANPRYIGKRMDINV